MTNDNTNLLNYLAIIANVAEILTASFAVSASAYYSIGLCRKRQKLEAYLQSEKLKKTDNGERTILHLMAKVGLTEDEILKASFRSHHIKRLTALDPKTNRAEAILLVYDETANSN